MRLVYATQVHALPQRTADTIPVLLYNQDGAPDGVGKVGGHAFRAIQHLDQPTSPVAFDFLTLALAVTAAETFVPRSLAADGWTRQLDLVVPLREPDRWLRVQDRLARALCFLTGDDWSLELKGWGPAAPPPASQDAIPLAGHDGVCLFSGGLDSAIGAIDLTTRGRRPLLISHAYRDDGPKQEEIQRHLPNSPLRFSTAALPKNGAAQQPDTTMRGRSLNFLAFAVVSASALQGGRDDREAEVIVPENGFIALNPPATLRRLGSLSTRTTHPHFLSEMEGILREVGFPVRFVNPYRHMTKGEMLRSCADQGILRDVAATSVSCGKWKRTRIQCGKCVPCLIRRASFHAAGWAPDPTRYSDKGTGMRNLLATGTPGQRGDLLALLRAVDIANTPELERRVGLTGPLPLASLDREPYVDVARRGLHEVGAFLASELVRGADLQEAA